MIACVREPVSQAVSWWKYEQNAMSWGEGMGLKKRNVLLRTPEYFSTNITDCFNFSKSKLTEAVYLSAEGMVQKKSDRELDNMGKLPPWATTWPGGQLTGISRNGRYSSNIGRYERVFGERFVDNSNYNGDRFTQFL